MEVWQVIITNAAFVCAVLIPVLTYYTKLVTWRSGVDAKMKGYDSMIGSARNGIEVLRQDYKADLRRIEDQHHLFSEKIYAVLDEIKSDIHKVSEDIAFIRGGKGGA